MIVRVQRLENLFVAAAIAVTFVAAGYQWWLLAAVFVVFDLSALGYVKNRRLGAVLYNSVHNYGGPAVLAGAYAVGLAQGAPVWALGLVSACWGFHVSVDRALGYGLKTDEGFQHTHLGLIGKRPRGASPRGHGEGSALQG